MHVFLEESTFLVRLRSYGNASSATSVGSRRSRPLQKKMARRFTSRVGPSWAKMRTTREVRVTLGRPHSRGNAIVLPLTWKAGLTATFLFLTESWRWLPSIPNGAG